MHSCVRLTACRASYLTYNSFRLTVESGVRSQWFAANAEISLFANLNMKQQYTLKSRNHLALDSDHFSILRYAKHYDQVSFNAHLHTAHLLAQNHHRLKKSQAEHCGKESTSWSEAVGSTSARRWSCGAARAGKAGVSHLGSHGRRSSGACGRSLAGGLLGCVGGAGCWVSGGERQNTARSVLHSLLTPSPRCTTRSPAA